MIDILKNNIELIEKLCKKHRIKSLYAFGSVLNERFTDDSDIDLYVSFENMNFVEYADNYFETAEDFEKLFKRKVDLITNKSLSNPYFIQSLNESKKVLYEEWNK